MILQCLLRGDPSGAGRYVPRMSARGSGASGATGSPVATIVVFFGPDPAMDDTRARLAGAVLGELSARGAGGR